MGNNEKNDCLYRCLWFYLHDNLPWKDDYQFKKALGIKQYDKITTDVIPRLEKLLKNVSINITGDFIYTSTLGKKIIIDLILINEHCTIDYKKIESKIRRVSRVELKPLMYNMITYEGYDGITTRKISLEEKINIFRVVIPS